MPEMTTWSDGDVVVATVEVKMSTPMRTD